MTKTCQARSMVWAPISPTWPLRAHLRGQFVAVGQIFRPADARLLDRIGQRLFAEHVQAAVHRPVRDEGMGVIGRRADDGIQVFLLQQEPVSFRGCS
jgi:hypothetical protein